MTEKVELGSDAWIARAGEVIEDCIAGLDLTGVRVAWHEEFTSPPAHLLPAGEISVTWFAVIDGSSVTVGRGRAEDPTFWMAVDYQVASSVARLRYDDPALAALAADLPPEAAPELHGDRGAVPAELGAALAGVHDALVPHTA